MIKELLIIFSKKVKWRIPYTTLLLSSLLFIWSVLVRLWLSVNRKYLLLVDRRVIVLKALFKSWLFFFFSFFFWNNKSSKHLQTIRHGKSLQTSTQFSHAPLELYHKTQNRVVSTWQPVPMPMPYLSGLWSVRNIMS